MLANANHFLKVHLHMQFLLSTATRLLLCSNLQSIVASYFRLLWGPKTLAVAITHGNLGIQLQYDKKNLMTKQAITSTDTLLEQLI